VHKYRLRVLLTLAFAAMFLSLLPGVLAEAGLSAPALWRSASAIASLFSIGFLGWWLVASRRMMQLVPEIFDSFAIVRMAAGHVAIIGVLIAVASLAAGFASAAYIAAMIWYLAHAAQQFSRMLFIHPNNP
jgi:hypothetical protein